MVTETPVIDETTIIREFERALLDKAYPCIAAKGAMARGNIRFLLARHFDCPADDVRILRFLYDFIAEFRKATGIFHSAVIIFREPLIGSEELFDTLLWQKLQALSALDAQNFGYDKRVNADPLAPDFSFSIGEEAFFIIGLHADSPRKSRRFRYPSMVFNPHAQFEELRKRHQYEKMKHIVRQRDFLFSGSVNPMLADFGERSEVYQYSGRAYAPSWNCPLKVAHARPGDPRGMPMASRAEEESQPGRAAPE